MECLVGVLSTHSIPKGLACESRIPQGGERPLRLSGWRVLWCVSLGVGLVPLPHLPRRGRKEGHVGWIGRGASRREQGPCNHAPLCSGASSAVSGREPGRQVKRDEGAAWSGILAHAHPRAYTAPPGCPSSPNQFSWVPKTPFSTRCGQSLRPEELAPQWREVVPYPKSWNWDAQSWLEQVGLIAVGKLLRNFTPDLTMQCHR